MIALVVATTMVGGDVFSQTTILLTEGLLALLGATVVVGEEDFWMAVVMGARTPLLTEVMGSTALI